jgi:tetrahydromethanopterin S-methyltransferase subunit B
MTGRRPKSGVSSLAKSKAVVAKQPIATPAVSSDVAITAEQERDRLRFELDAAHERIAELEKRQAEITRRLTAMLKAMESLRAEQD